MMKRIYLLILMCLAAFGYTHASPQVQAKEGSIQITVSKKELKVGGLSVAGLMGAVLALHHGVQFLKAVKEWKYLDEDDEKDAYISLLTSIISSYASIDLFSKAYAIFQQKN